MILVDHPTLWHAQCLVTGRADPKNGPYVDLLRDFAMEHQGRMYVSGDAVRTMAKLLDFPTPEEFEHLCQQVADLEQDKHQLEVELVEALKVNDAFDVITKKAKSKPKMKEPSHA